MNFKKIFLFLSIIEKIVKINISILEYNRKNCKDKYFYLEKIVKINISILEYNRKNCKDILNILNKYSIELMYVII